MTTIVEVASRINVTPTLWARPVTWRGSGRAITGLGDLFGVVPQELPGLQQVWHPSVADILEEWEFVQPHQVVVERMTSARDEALH